MIIHSNSAKFISDKRDISSHITNKNISNNDNIYNYCQKLIVHNDEEIEALRLISECNGWWMFEVIDSIGIWEVTTVKLVREQLKFYKEIIYEHIDSWHEDADRVP